jgi:hypothetical protein
MAGRPKARQPTARELRESRAREERLLRRKRVAEIRGLMADFLWETGVTGPELAAKWKLSSRTVETYAREASEQIGLAVEDNEKLSARIEANLVSNARACREIANRAMKSPKQARTAVAALEAARDTVAVLLKFRGLEAPTKVNVGGNLAELLALADSPVPARPQSD